MFLQMNNKDMKTKSLKINIIKSLKQKIIAGKKLQNKFKTLALTAQHFHLFTKQFENSPKAQASENKDLKL